jgi:Fe2+ transport system protein FeoA
LTGDGKGVRTMSTGDTAHLDQLEPHQCGCVEEVEAPDDELERLMAMGVCAGRTVEVVQRGDPLILRVYGTRVGVSARLAARIRVRTCSPDTCAADSYETS